MPFALITGAALSQWAEPSKAEPVHKEIELHLHGTAVGEPKKYRKSLGAAFK